MGRRSGRERAMQFPVSIYIIDIFFVLMALLASVQGARRGFSGELARIITLVVFLVGGLFFYPLLVKSILLLYGEHVDAAEPSLTMRIMVHAPLLLMLLAGGFFFFVLLRTMLKRIMTAQFGEANDKTFGFLTGLVRGVLLGLAVLTALSMVSSDYLHTQLNEHSYTGRLVCHHITSYVQPRLMELPLFEEQD